MKKLYDTIKTFVIEKMKFKFISKEAIIKYVSEKKYVLLISVIAIAVLYVGISKIYDHFYQKQLLKNKEVNIVFNTDLSYKDVTKVAIRSASINKNPDSVYNINVLCVDMTKEQCEEFNAFNSNKRNVYINLIPLKSEKLEGIGDYEIRHYVTRTDLFKFLFPDILKGLDKVLYIDGDTLILNDLSDLYNTDIRKYRLAAVKKINNPTRHIHLFSNTLFAVDLYTEIYEYNCGVMLFNLKKFRKDKVSKKLIAAKNKDEKRELHTQTSFNEVIPYHTIKHLSPIYNTYSRWDFHDKNIEDFKKTFKPFIGKDINTMEEYYDTVVILHYAGRKKPWNSKDVKHFHLWWKQANKINPNWKFGKDFVNITEVKAQ